MGWYAMALVDVLDWMPADQAQRPELIAALNRTMAAVVKYQDAKTGLWWQVMDKGGRAGNYTEASASCMFVYALAKGVRLGYLPQADKASARRGWDGIQKAFVTTDDGKMALSGTVTVGGLGGKPYRSGSYEYYIGEKTRVNDAKGVGAFLLAGSEMEQASTEALGQRKTVLVDAWFNSQTRQNAAGQTELFHYKWDDDSNNGFAFFGRAFQAEIIGVDNRAVDGDRMHHTKLLKLAHERQIRINIAVPASHFQHTLCFFLAFLLLHRREIVAEQRVLERGDELGVIVIVAEVGMSVGVSPNADLRFPETVGRAVLAHLTNSDLARTVRMDIVRLLLRGFD